MSTAQMTIEAYWMPGCSSCLRMKEFLEKSGKPFTAINVDEHPEARVKLNAHHLLLPATFVGDHGVNGVDLGAVAELIGVPYEPPVMLHVAAQVSRVMRAFLTAYEDDAHDKNFYSMPDDITNKDDVLASLDATRKMFNRWWEDEGQDDPLDRVTPTYWGYPTLHEVLEREVWHTTQHTRQLVWVIEQFGATPVAPLIREKYLDGLPLPERVND
jgi:glutaredoxin